MNRSPRKGQVIAVMANPTSNPRRRKKARSAAQKAATKRMLAANKRKKNPGSQRTTSKQARKNRRVASRSAISTEMKTARRKRPKVKSPRAGAGYKASSKTRAKKRSGTTSRPSGARPAKLRRGPRKAVTTAKHTRWESIPRHYRRTNPEKNPMKRHRRSRRRSKRNPSLSAPNGIGAGMGAVLFGGLAALVGTVGGIALVKAGLTNKWANTGLHAGLGIVAGGGLGMVDRAAGTVVAHNFMLNAMNWAMAPEAVTQAAGASARSKALRGYEDDDDMGAILDSDGNQIAGVILDNNGMGDVYDDVGSLAGMMDH